jgi:hypothetical protein
MFTRYVNWFDEELHITYGDDNNGLIHGVYVYDDENEVVHVEWFKTEEERENVQVYDQSI